MSRRVALLRMQDDGLIPLPPPRSPGRIRKPCRIAFSPLTLPGPPVVEPVHLLTEPCLNRVRGKGSSRLFNENLSSAITTWVALR